jgi:Sulfotransferase domain
MASRSKNGRRRRLPEFVGVGSIRTASTWLHLQLQNHTGLPLVKESNFFNRYHDRGLDWYASLFRNAPIDQPLGEFCPTYFPVTAARDRICRDLPGCKIIVALRDPVERAYSHFKMLRHDGYLPNVPFEQALEINPGIVNSSRYATHLMKWFEGAGRENVLVCFYDDLLLDPQGFLNRVCDFIGIGRVAVVELDKRAINSFEAAPKSAQLGRLAIITKTTLQSRDWFRTDAFLDRIGFFAFCRGRGERFPAVPPEAASRLRKELLPEIDALEQLVSRDLSGWKTPRKLRSSIHQDSGTLSNEDKSTLSA